MTELLVLENKQPIDIFKEEAIEDIVSKIEEEVRSIATDVSTAKGRKEIASLAAKVSRSKTALDGMGKDLVSGWKKQAKLVDDQRKVARERLDALRDEVRKPLTDFENAEKQRVAEREDRIKQIQTLALNFKFKSDNELKADLAKAEELFVADGGSYDWQEFILKAGEAYKSTTETLNQAISFRKEQEELKLQAEKLKKEQEALERAEREKKIAERAAAAERDRVEKEVKLQQQKADAEKNKAIAEAKRVERLKAEEEMRQKALEETKLKLEEETKRRKENETAVLTSIKEALMLHGIDEARARGVIISIRKGDIKHLKIEY